MLREAGIGASSIYSGLTALRKANYAEQSLYDQAFFGISIGLERMMKLAILIHARTAAGTGPPTEKQFRREYSHDLLKLFAKIEEIRVLYAGRLHWSLPNIDVSLKALGIISDFAQITRYYNMDLLVGSARVTSMRDPVEAWYSEIASWILEVKYPEKRKARDERWAEFLDATISEFSAVAFTAEDGTPISTIREATLRSSQMEIIQREGTVVCACLARHVSELFFPLEMDARKNGAADVPSLHEFFAFLNNKESFFRSRKTFG
ncbi:hypothetical protein [Micromonospora sp. WMMD964]|uniref:hypothetical protein n=1 Tax=Micromonospora sp. WMMD964 TaxID=3016091 RepID=UPI00249A6067|nr:hypothetical protein [Micromonospora sp. WMMD964]WFF01806.1 hypothetical protein O7616_03170 [Micromonospora sp. WMMD964]